MGTNRFGGQAVGNETAEANRFGGVAVAEEVAVPDRSYAELGVDLASSFGAGAGRLNKASAVFSFTRITNLTN